MLENILSKYKAGFDGFTQLRGQNNIICGVSYNTGSAAFVGVNHRSFGLCASVFKDGAYGFAALPEYSDAAVKKVLDRARANAVMLGRARNTPLSPVPETENGSIMRSFNNRYLSERELCSFAESLGKYAEGKKNGIKAFINILEDNVEKLLIVSNGYDYHNVENLCNFEMSLLYEPAGEEAVTARKMVYPKKTVSELIDDPSELYAAIDALMDELAVSKDEAKQELVFAEGGEWDCVLMPTFTAMLAHEAVGHTMEADAVLEKGSVGREYMGKLVASPLVSLTDYHANVCGGASGLLDIPVDDEGVKCIDAPIIKDGVLCGAMTDRRTAHELGLPMTGNARASLYHDTTIIRMRNTCFHPGTSKLDDMIAAIDRGYFLKRSGGGNGSLKGEFNMVADEIYEIRGGKVGKKVKPTTVAGIAWDALKTVDMVSEEFVMDDICGTCGKADQSIHTASGGAAFKMRLNIAGR